MFTHDTLIERPRTHGTGGSKGYRRQTNRLNREDALPSREKMRDHVSDRKISSDLIGPLRRYLGSQVGSKWDVVFSNVCGLVGKGMDRHHLLLHVKYEVEQDVVERNGEVVESQTGYAIRPGRLYVLNGILCRVPYRARLKYVRKLAVTFTGQMTGVSVRNGQWFEVTFAQYTPNMKLHNGAVMRDAGRRDVLLADVVKQDDCILAYGKPVIAVTKRAMNKREIRKFRQER